jgi:integrase/recombinase XerD
MISRRTALHALAWGYGGGLEAQLTPSVKVEDGRRIKFLDQDQLRAFFAAMPSEAIRDRLLFALMYRFGMRVSEVVQLPARAIDRKRGEITIAGLKSGLTRTYSLPSDLLKLVKRWKPTGDTFLHGRQGPLSRVRAYQLFRQYAKAAGIPKGFSPHSLRHSAAVHALDAGLATEDVRDLLRHRRLATTDLYAAISTRRRGDYLKRLEASGAIVKLR